MVCTRFIIFRFKLCIRAFLTSGSNIYSDGQIKEVHTLKRYPSSHVLDTAPGARVAPDIKVLLQTTKNYGSFSVNFLVSPQLMYI